MAIAGIDTLYDYTKLASSVGGTENTDTVLVLSGKAATDGFRYYIVDDDETTPLLTEQTAIKQTYVSMTSAQIKLLATTQIELIPAQGANTVIEVLGGLVMLDYGGSNAFTGATNNLSAKYTDDSGAIVSELIEMSNFIDQTADTFLIWRAVSDDACVIAATAGIVNQAVVIDNVGSNFAGNAAGDNVLKWWTKYRVWYVG